MYFKLTSRLTYCTTKLNDVNSTANPNYTADELAYQLDTTKSKVLLCHPDVVDIALAAGRQAGIAADHIILMQSLTRQSPIPFPTIEDLVSDGLKHPKCFTERTLSPGEAKTKIAFYCFSSGTTGKPKVNFELKTFRSELSSSSGRCDTTLRGLSERHSNGQLQQSK